jgi:hypothetical protein
VASSEIELQNHQSATDYSDGAAVKKAKRQCLLGLLGLASIIGVLDQVFVDDRSSDRLLTTGSAVIAVVLIAAWCHYDSWQRSYTIGTPLRILILLLAAIGVPVYLLRTRGWRGLISIVLAGAFLGLMIVLEWAACVVTYRLLLAIQ